MDYKKAGVDIEAGYRSVELMKKHVKETIRPEVLGGLGGFSGAFSLAAMKDMEKDTRDALFYAIRLLFKSNFKVLLEDLQAGTEKKKTPKKRVFQPKNKEEA